MDRWNIARVDDVHVVTMTSNKINAMNDGFFSDLARALVPDTLAAYAALKTQLLAPALAAFEASREQVNRGFLDVWFSEEGHRRLGEVRDRLLRRS